MAKTRTILLGVLPLLLLFSCGGEASSSSLQSSSEEASPSSESTSSEISSSETTSSSSSSQSSSESSIAQDAVYDFYCVNDFHGSVLERDEKYYEAGIAKYFGKLRAYKNADPDHTFILSAGDMFQGSLESNSNYGKLVMDAMNDVPFDAMTLGNHEFDYGQDRLKALIDRAEFPILGGNVVKYENGRATSTIWYDGIQTSTVIERGGNKIGIVGMIGTGQTTSIASQLVQDIDFADWTSKAFNASKKLREEEGCSIVILVIHDSYKSANIAANKQYFDGIFAGHSHAKEVYLVDGVPIVQSYCNGEAISHFQLTIESGVVTCTKRETVSSNSNWKEDSSIAEIRDTYLDEGFNELASRPAGTVEGTLGAKEGVANLSVKSIYEKYKPLYPDLALAMCNGQRSALSGDIDYSEICKALPFTNCIVIANVLGEDILREGGYNNTYTGDLENYGTLDPDEIYQIACTDYVLFHQNTSKVYNYFPCLNPGGGGEWLEIYEDYPFDIFFDYCVNELEGVIDAEQYTNSSPGFAVYA